MVDTACSSSLYTVDIGVKGLLMGRQDIAVCGGSFSLAPRGSVPVLEAPRALGERDPAPARQGRRRRLFSDGAGVVVIKRMKRALEDGDRILCVLKAFGSSSTARGRRSTRPARRAADRRRARARRAGGPPPGSTGSSRTRRHARRRPGEFTGLRETYAGDRTVHVTSNKVAYRPHGLGRGRRPRSIEGSSLQNQTIPPQHQWDEAPTTSA
jgi:3-oxoacyl-(acyl-carrier-protein) synthase